MRQNYSVYSGNMYYLLRYKLTKHLLERYNSDVIKENIPKDSNTTSYTGQKGKTLYVCLREKETGQNNIEKYDLLLFVLLHELTHISTNTKHHGPEFWHIFKVILHEAEKAGIYKPVDYTDKHIVYCSLKITYNPYFDNNLSEEFLYEIIDQI
jgi:hypothetical protein